MKEQKFKYLALGDSYTIGEGVQESERYPMVLVELLKEENILFDKPMIIATTGWTTDELQKGIADTSGLNEAYDLVTLLIGVNNQYRGRDLENFKEEFASLLDKAIAFAGNHPDQVFVLSIPDWGITPFAKGKEVDQEKVAAEIDSFNNAKEEISRSKGVSYTDITDHYRMHGDKEGGVVADKLHPSAKIYLHWAEQLRSKILKAR
ncbi:SGNH/GDSL hydrolase family protein [Anditalea andensis]|nr:SGNH/GDSL hydrolase family protein [Anditalea andensis]